MRAHAYPVYIFSRRCRHSRRMRAKARFQKRAGRQMTGTCIMRKSWNAWSRARAPSTAPAACAWQKPRLGHQGNVLAPRCGSVALILNACVTQGDTCAHAAIKLLKEMTSGMTLKSAICCNNSRPCSTPVTASHCVRDRAQQRDECNTKAMRGTSDRRERSDLCQSARPSHTQTRLLPPVIAHPPCLSRTHRALPSHKHHIIHILFYLHALI